MEHLPVLIVARPGDEHGDQVEEAIRSRGKKVGRLSLNTFRQKTVEWEPGGPLRVDSATESFLIGPTSTIWWRRPGWVECDDLEADEVELIDSEVRTMVDGILMSSGAKWIDHPMVVQQAENKLYQLAVACNGSVPIPQSKVTNSVEAARKLAAQNSIVAKTVSVGEGIAPFVDEVPADLLERVSRAPVLLQERIDAVADLRIVTVGDRAFSWSRERRSGEPIDWRRPDPAGEEFEPFQHHDSEAGAVLMAENLGLTHSSQDWLDTPAGPVFLEANPGGQWLFLPNAKEIVIPALVDHLCGSEAS